MLGVLLCLALVAVGCNGSGGGSSGSANDSSVASSTAVDLPPGQTSVQLAWEPSEGNIDGYMTFRSDNDGPFQFVALVPDPTIRISGSPGDSVRLLVVALGTTGVYSPASPPSPAIRFHAAVETAEAVEARTQSGVASAAVASAVADPTSTSPSTSTSGPEADPAAALASHSADPSENGSDGKSSVRVPVDGNLFALLVRANARLPRLGLDSHAGRWFEAIVDEEVAAGVSLAGTGAFDGDGLRDLVWQDAAGRLIVSDGAAVTQNVDLASTMTDMLRLLPSEVFVGLADFDRDGLGDWLLEDSVTGEVWIVDGAGQETTFAGPEATASASRLLAYGDFDADGRAELLWQGEDRSLSLSHPDGGVPNVEWPSADFELNDVLAIADFDGDGGDDLLTRRPDGRLEMALSTATSGGIGFESVLGPDQTTVGLDLLAILDLDQVGAPEIVWLNGEALEIWDAMTGPLP